MVVVTDTADVAIVGAGAAGLATAIFCGRAAAGRRIVVIDGARRVGAKILVSGGSRCNVTNRIVTERDFWGGTSRVVRNVLRAFPADRAAGFFEQLGVSLHEEEDGKLFPDTNRARTVLDALLGELSRVSAHLDSGQRVIGIDRNGGAFDVRTPERVYRARAVVLATGGRSLPKTGSDGFGYELARRLGHGYVETTPALAPLILDGEWHASLSGVAHPAAVTIRSAGDSVTSTGPLLWTHFGASGPVILNASRHWHRARVEGRDVEVRLNVCPGEALESCEEWLIDQAAARPRALVGSVLAARLPAVVAELWATRGGVRDTTMAHLTREGRRMLARALVEWPLQVRDSRGYNYAEVTAGGVPLDDIDPATMQSRACPGLFLVGEILDVDGRLGGFNFQWAWSSAWVAAHAIAKQLAD
jgi:predicted Rossmann fold flavoprotein